MKCMETYRRGLVLHNAPRHMGYPRQPVSSSITKGEERREQRTEENVTLAIISSRLPRVGLSCVFASIRPTDTHIGTYRVYACVYRIDIHKCSHVIIQDPKRPALIRLIAANESRAESIHRPLHERKLPTRVPRLRKYGLLDATRRSPRRLGRSRYRIV